MSSDWEKIYASTHLQQVEIRKALLAQNNIQGVIINKKDSLYNFGEIELFVNRSDVLKAIQIINKFSGE